jgi:hypothetical protein
VPILLVLCVRKARELKTIHYGKLALSEDSKWWKPEAGSRKPEYVRAAAAIVNEALVVVGDPYVV